MRKEPSSRKGRMEILGKVLEVLYETGVTAADLLEVFLNARYGASFSELQRALAKRESKRVKDAAERNRLRKELQSYYSFVYRLKKDGLLRTEEKSGSLFYTLTAKGLEKSSFWMENRLPMIRYEPEKSEQWIVIAFDIPEKDKRKREWLRMVLRNLGFRLVQRSVWLGKVKLPQEFLEDVKRLRLAECIEVFEVRKPGSLSHFL